MNSELHLGLNKWEDISRWLGFANTYCRAAAHKERFLKEILPKYGRGKKVRGGVEIIELWQSKSVEPLTARERRELLLEVIEALPEPISTGTDLERKMGESPKHASEDLIALVGKNNAPPYKMNQEWYEGPKGWRRSTWAVREKTGWRFLRGEEVSFFLGAMDSYKRKGGRGEISKKIREETIYQLWKKGELDDEEYQEAHEKNSSDFYDALEATERKFGIDIDMASRIELRNSLRDTTMISEIEGIYFIGELVGVEWVDDEIKFIEG